MTLSNLFISIKRALNFLDSTVFEAILEIFEISRVEILLVSILRMGSSRDESSMASSEFEFGFLAAFN
jgi:hypothetical protein